MFYGLAVPQVPWKAFYVVVTETLQGQYFHHPRLTDGRVELATLGGWTKVLQRNVLGFILGNVFRFFQLWSPIPAFCHANEVKWISTKEEGIGCFWVRQSQSVPLFLADPGDWGLHGNKWGMSEKGSWILCQGWGPHWGPDSVFKEESWGIKTALSQCRHYRVSFADGNIDALKRNCSVIKKRKKMWESWI